MYESSVCFGCNEVSSLIHLFIHVTGYCTYCMFAFILPDSSTMSAVV